MTLFEVLENKDQYFAEDIGYQLQRWVSFTLAGVTAVASLTGWGVWGVVAAIWFLISTLWPATIGRITAMLTIVLAAIIITMGDTTGGSLIQPALAIATIPLIFVSALLASRRFADTCAAVGLYTYQKIFKRKSLGT